MQCAGSAAEIIDVAGKGLAESKSGLTQAKLDKRRRSGPRYPRAHGKKVVKGL